MDLEQAFCEVANIGNSYFLDDLDRFTVDQIIHKMITEVMQAKTLSGLYYSEITANAFFMIITELSLEKMDQILLQEFGLRPGQVGGSREFFQRVAIELTNAIRVMREKLTE